MAIVKTTLSLTDQDRQWMNEIIASGEYVSNSEYVRNLIHRDKEQRTESHAEIELIRAKLLKAEQSGFTNKNRDEILEDIKEKARRNGVYKKTEDAQVDLDRIWRR